MAGGEATHLRADDGVYDSVAEHMELSGNVQIKNGRFTVLLRTARFDFKSGVYGSDEPVEVQAGDGTTIVADRAAAVHHGQELTFEGHVRTRIVPQANQPPTAGYKKGLTYDVAISGSWMVGGDWLLRCSVQAALTRRLKSHPDPATRSQSFLGQLQRSRSRSTPTSSFTTTRSIRRFIPAMSSSFRATQR